MAMTRSESGAAHWPQELVNGRFIDAVTNTDPTTGLPFCKDCWDGKHPRNGCTVTACKCGCYHGRIKSQSGLNRPRKGFDTELPDVETISI